VSAFINWVTTPYTIFLILKDPTVPAGVKWRAIIGLVLIFAYVISPIDIIPDVVPFAGWLDDLIVVPAGFSLLRMITPGIDVKEKQDVAQKKVRKVVFGTILALVAAVLLGLAFLALVITIIVKLITG
jgi:uncharacterized membrane protein YkvA (DUF1232 family)